MTHLRAVGVRRYSVDRLREQLTPPDIEALVEQCLRYAGRGPTVWHVNSTAAGGGVAEMIAPLVGYGRELGLDVRWLVIQAGPEFFEITKRVDNGISGVPGDGGPLGEAEHEIYAGVSRDAAAALGSYVRRGDVVFLHDPQTTGLVAEVSRIGATPIWRAHNGADQPNEHTERSWAFLRRYLAEASAVAFTRQHFCPAWVSLPVYAITPFIDPGSPKNVPMDAGRAADLLAGWGILAGGRSPDPGRHATIVREGPAPGPSTPMLTQVSRWDPVKDMEGVLLAFAEHLVDETEAYLSLIGPEVTGVADDPEAGEYFERCVATYRNLPGAVRRRSQLVCLPMADPTANAVAVNAAQTHGCVVTQKSISEGFGLTVAEAMWKGTAVVASDVGGTSLQIEHKTSGLLVDCDDREQFARAVGSLLNDPASRQDMGSAARERIRSAFLPDKHFLAELALIDDLTKGRPL